MTKLTHRHVEAVTRAQHLLETGINVSGNENLALAIRKDVQTFCELRQILYFALENPTLPFTLDEEKPV